MNKGDIKEHKYGSILLHKGFECNDGIFLVNVYFSNLVVYYSHYDEL